jgi:hypothetical protein
MTDAAMGLVARLACTGDFVVGARSAANRLTLRIDYRGEQGLARARWPALVLHCGVGGGEGDLVRDAAQLRRWSCRASAGWVAQWRLPPERPERCELWLLRRGEVLLQPGDALEVVFSGATSDARPGLAALELRLQERGDAVAAAVLPLQLAKRGSAAGVLGFACVPEAAAVNLPGDVVELRWRTCGLSDLSLLRDGLCIAEGLADEGHRRVVAGVADAEFALRGWDEAGQRHEAGLRVRALRPGWQRWPCMLATRAGRRLAVPATAATSGEALPLRLFGVAGGMLYASVALPGVGGARVLLCRARHALGPWELVGAMGAGKGGGPFPAFPHGGERLPGVLFRGRLWLLGGPSAAQGRCGSTVWSLDVGAREPRWRDHGEAPWCARRAHGVAVFEDRLWVFGGIDSAGAPLDDAWAATQKPAEDAVVWTPAEDGKPVDQAAVPTLDWQVQAAGGPRERPRGAAQPVLHDGRLWLFGRAGAANAGEEGSEPLGEEDEERREGFDLWSFDGLRWERSFLLGDLIGGQVLAGALASDGRSLYVFAWTSRHADAAHADAERVEAIALRLVDAPAKRWAVLPCEDLQGLVPAAIEDFQVLALRAGALVVQVLAAENECAAGRALRLYFPA